MHRRSLGWTGVLLTLSLTLLSVCPSASYGQDALGYALPAEFVPTPLSSTRPEEGFFVNYTFGMYLQTVPLGDQTVATRGFLDIDGSIGGVPFVFAGSNRIALTTKQVTGPQSQLPSHRVGMGYRFFEGGVLEFNWLHVNTIRYSAVATPVPQDLFVRPDLADSFLFAPVVNFPTDFSGPGDDINGGAAYGVWNGAELMTIDFTQRLEQAELVYRMAPVIDTLCWRTYGYFGPRFVWFWERFRWRSFDQDSQGQSQDIWNAYYTNIISNRMYGIKCGCGNDWYIGNGISINLDGFVTPMLNIVTKRAQYERGDRRIGPIRKRTDRDYTLVPEFGASLAVNWFPYEGIQVKASYNIMAYFNTVTSEDPIDLDYSGINPDYDRTFRLVRGFEIGICFRF
jgi:hypothetical protein